MDWSVVLNSILIPGLIGLGGLLIWLVKFYIPAIEKRKDAELQAKLKESETRLKAELENRKDKREHNQASENIAITILESIIRESIQEHSKESQGLQNLIVLEVKDVIYRLGRQVDNNTQSVRALAGIISEQKNNKLS